MTEERIPFGPAQETGWEALAGAGAEAFNVVVDGRGALRRRPGIAPYFDDADAVVDDGGIVGIHYTNTGALYAWGDRGGSRKTYRLLPSGATLLTGDVLGGRRPIIAETQTLLVVAAGDRIQKVSLEADVTAPLGGNPPKSTHIIAHASRLASIEIETAGLLDRINFSAPQTGTIIAGYETWNGPFATTDSGPFPLNARPDPLLALHENTNEVFAFGSTTLQVIASDPQSVYAPVNTREFGIGAPYSVVKDDQNFAWLDDSRRFVHSDGRSFQLIADPIKQPLDDMREVGDCFGFRVVTGPTDALVWTFPTDGRTFAYQRGAGWGQWGGWDGRQWRPFRVRALTRAAGPNQNIVGFDDGRVGIFDHRVNDDLGEPINAVVTTGFIDHGTDAKKHCESVRVKLRRVEELDAANPAVLLEWRDDLGPWQGPLEYALGPAGQDEVVLKSYGLGVYRTRQWRLTFSGSSALSVAGVTEVFTVQDI